MFINSFSCFSTLDLLLCTSKSIVMLIVVVFYCFFDYGGGSGLCHCGFTVWLTETPSVNIHVLVARSRVGMRSELCNVQYRLVGIWYHVTHIEYCNYDQCMEYLRSYRLRNFKIQGHSFIWQIQSVISCQPVCPINVALLYSLGIPLCYMTIERPSTFDTI